jgi:hypothetical protein
MEANGDLPVTAPRQQRDPHGPKGMPGAAWAAVVLSSIGMVAAAAISWGISRANLDAHTQAITAQGQQLAKLSADVIAIPINQHDDHDAIEELKRNAKKDHDDVTTLLETTRAMANDLHDLAHDVRAHIEGKR